MRKFWPSYRQWNPYYINICHVKVAKHVFQLADVNALNSESPIFKYPAENQSFKSHDDIVWLQFLLRHDNCLPDTIYYKLNNAQLSDQYSVHKIIPDMQFVCELHVTVMF